jgi:hypothetical protein
VPDTAYVSLALKQTDDGLVPVVSVTNEAASATRLTVRVELLGVENTAICETTFETRLSAGTAESRRLTCPKSDRVRTYRVVVRAHPE